MTKPKPLTKKNITYSVYVPDEPLLRMNDVLSAVEYAKQKGCLCFLQSKCPHCKAIDEAFQLGEEK